MGRTRCRVLVVAGLAVAVAAASGFLVVGPSVSRSLERLAPERVGRADAAVTAPGFLREEIASELAADPDLTGLVDAIAPVVALDGLVSARTGGRQAHATVYGVDDRFWQLHRAQGIAGPTPDSAFLSPGLANALASAPGSGITVRIESVPDAPAESVHGRKDGASRVLQLSATPVPDGSPAAQFSLSSTREGTYAVFVPIHLLQQDARRAHVNLVLLAAKPNAEINPDALRSALRRRMALDDFGLTLRANEARTELVLESTTGLIDDVRGDRASQAAVAAGALPTPVMTAIVSSIGKGDRTIPYVFVTATELQTLAPDVRAEESSRPPIVLNDVSARRLGASIGDVLTVRFPVWAEPGRLESHAAEVEVASVVPISGLAADLTLTPSIPGITGAALMHEWRPRFPFDAGLIGSVDEEYWAKHKTTPVAFIPWQVARALWRTRAGALTSTRIEPPRGMSTDALREPFTDRLRQELSPGLVGVDVRSLRTEAGAAAASNGLATRMLWASVPLTVVGLLLSTAFFAAGAFTPREALRLTAVGVAAGLLLAFPFSVLLLNGLRAIWPGGDLGLHLSSTAVAGFGVAAALSYTLMVGSAHVANRSIIRSALSVVVVVLAAWLAYQYRQQPDLTSSRASKDGTGGFSLIARATVPLIHDPSGPEGLEQLGLAKLEGVKVTALRVRDGDDLSAVNLLHPVHPRIVGVSHESIAEGRFSFVSSLDRNDDERANPWMLLEREQRDPDDPSALPGPPIVPVIAGRTAISTLFAGRLGGDHIIVAAAGPVRLRAVAALATSILDDALIMSDSHFVQLFPTLQGYRTLLIDAPTDRLDDVQSRLGRGLVNLGGTIERSVDRLNSLAAVSRTLGTMTLYLLGAALLLAVAGLTTYTLFTP